MADEEGTGGLVLAGAAQIEATFRRVLREQQGGESAEARQRQKKLQAIRQIPIATPQIPLTAGAGALAMPDLVMAKTGYNWSIRRMVAVGFTAGTVTVWKNGIITGTAVTAGEQLFTFPSAGTYTFGRGEMLLNEEDALVFSATGITGIVQLNGAADCFETWLLADYLL